MLKQENNKEKVVKLGEGVLVRTKLKDVYIPALRSGFAGYPLNPRWSGVKFYAWKTGKQWRQAMLRGEMVVCGDGMLVAIAEVPEVDEEENSQKWDCSPTTSNLDSYRFKLPQLTM